MDIHDDYFHEDPSLYYITESIPSQITTEDINSKNLYRDFEEQIIGCRCVSCEENPKCSCITKLGELTPNYTSQRNEIILSDTLLEVDRPIYECNSTCRCYPKCFNRLVQNGPRKNLEVQGCGDKGAGVFTKLDIPKGAFVCEYAGEVISKEEAHIRHEFNEENHKMNYIICLNEHAGSDIYQTFVDPSKFGNIGRYFNHSCDPNCIMLAIRIENMIPKLCLFAKNHIGSNVELTFDYGSVKNSDYQSNDIRTLKQCSCGSVNCRKWLPNFYYDK